WFDHVEEVCVRIAQLRQRTLVLTCNFAETVELAQRLRVRGVAQVIEHARGERLNESLSAFRARDDGILIAPNLWEGVDLPGLVRHLVVTRLPIASRHSPAMQIESERLQAEGLSDDDVTLRIFDILSRRARRTLAHGLGRAVRQVSDDAQVWVTDPRFPLPDSLTGNPRLRLPANIPVYRDFVKCIPRRFRAGLLATYPSSTLIEVEPYPHAAAVTKRKGRSRRA
ncbi:MAG: helicase C-terminal domain-containing protein, partial [Asticcacaulis sp.]